MSQIAEEVVKILLEVILEYWKVISDLFLFFFLQQMWTLIFSLEKPQQLLNK